MPPVPPEQAVAAKDMVLSHAPRAANKKHHEKAAKKQTPQSPAAKVAETVMVSIPLYLSFSIANDTSRRSPRWWLGRCRDVSD
jgi:hypothetical protein